MHKKLPFKVPSHERKRRKDSDEETQLNVIKYINEEM